MTDSKSSLQNTEMNRSGTYSRPLSVFELGHIIFDELRPPLVNQMVVEGIGELDTEQWQSAVKEASAANPGSRLVLKGFSVVSRWVDTGKAPPVREIDGSAWSGLTPDGAPILQERLLPDKWPTCEVILMHGNPSRVIFRTHHSVMDGRGTMTWAEDIFRALRGESIIGAYSRIIDIELARSFQKEYREFIPSNCPAPTGKTKGKQYNSTWRRMQIKGRFHNLSSQIAVIIANEARKNDDENVWIMVPVDMRSRKRGLRSTGNLTLPIFLEIKPDDTPQKVFAGMFKQLYERRDGMIGKFESYYRFVPRWILKRGARKFINELHNSSRYQYSAAISSLGSVNLEPYTCSGFNSETLFFIPPSVGYSPAFIVTVETKNTVELTCSMPNMLASDGRLETLMECIAAGLTT